MKTLIVASLLLVSVFTNSSIASAEEAKVVEAVKKVEDKDDLDDKNTEKNIDELREEFKRNKAAFVANAMNLTPEESAKFWEVYADYDSERTALGDKRIKLLDEYIKSFTTMTDDTAKELSDKHYEVQKELLELRQKYVTKYQEAMNPIVAARFAQVEFRTQLLLDLSISANLPLIEKPVE